LPGFRRVGTSCDDFIKGFAASSVQTARAEEERELLDVSVKEAHMNLVRWGPFRQLDGIHARLSRMLGERPLRGFDTDTLSFGEWAPAVDIQETDKEYIVKADLPEVKKEDVKVEFEDGMLTMEGERQLEKEEKGRKFHKIEREYGKFVRRFALPREVDAGKLSADFRDGVLNVHLPKSPEIKPKAVTVNVQ
jgi:HSP20 family protein